MDWRHVVQAVPPVRSKHKVPVKASSVLYNLVSFYHKRGKQNRKKKEKKKKSRPLK
jgi:hypothetical protein